MKKLFGIGILVIAALIAICGCASFSANIEPEDTNPNALSLDGAIQRTAEEISAALPEGRRVAVMNFDSETPELSMYVMEELSSRLAIPRKLIVVDRQNIAYIEKELNFQMSGAVSDESAQGIGKMLGAESITVGSLTKRGTSYSWRINVLGVESAVTEVPVMLDVRGGREYTALLADLKSSKKAADTTAREIALARIPQTAADYLNRGLTFANRGDYEIAIADFTDAVKLDPKMVIAYVMRGKALIASVTSVYNRAEDFDRIMFYGLKADAPKKPFNDALADFNQAIKINPNFADAYILIGVIYHINGDYDQHIAILNQLIRIDPNYAWAYYNRGIAYTNKKDYDRAIADYNQAIRLDPNLALAYFGRGNAYYDKGDYDRAIADYTEAIRLDPDFANVYNNRGNAYYNKGDYDRAIADYTQAIRIDPSDTTAKNNLQIVQNAAELARKNEARAYITSGNAYYSNKDYDRAIAEYNKAIRLDPSNTTAKNNLQLAQNAKVAAEVSAYITSGNAYYSNKDYDRAIAEYNKAIQLDPNNANAYNGRGNAYYMKAYYQWAIADYTQALKLDPNHANAKKWIEEARKWVR